MGFWQMRHLKSFFEAKKLVWLEDGDQRKGLLGLSDDDEEEEEGIFYEQQETISEKEGLLSSLVDVDRAGDLGVWATRMLMDVSYMDEK